jgi:N4-gp56 family major capsid protein
MAAQQNIVGGSTGNYVNLANVVLDVYSQEIMFKSQPVLRFESVVVQKEDLSVNPGGRIAFLLYNAMNGPSAIAETSTIDTETMSTSLRYISVGEHARAIGVSELLLRQSITDVLSDASAILGQHYAKARDQLIRDAFYTSPNTTFGDGTVATRSVLTTGATGLMSMTTIRNGVEILATNKAPKFNGDAYVCFVHPHQGRYLRQDSGWLSVVQYGDPTRVYNGEIGRIEDVRFIETTMIQVIKARSGSSGTFKSVVRTDAQTELYRDLTAGINGDGTVNLSNVAQTGVAAGNGSRPDTDFPTVDTYRAILCGDNSVGLAQSLPVEMRDNGVEDFGRKHSLAYYCIYGAGRIEDGHAMILETS